MMASVRKYDRKRILTSIITVFLAVCVTSMAVTKIVYDTIFSRYDEFAPVPRELEQMVEQRQICRFASGENELTGYYYSAPEPENAKGLILLVPGFHAGGDDYLWQISELRQYGWGVFTFDVTGTLRSEGKRQVGFSQPISDLEAALKYVENNERFGYNEIVLMGHSRGAYTVCCALAQPWDVAAVVSVSGINSAMEGIMEMSVQTVGPVSYGNYGFLWLYQAMLFGTDTLQLQAAEAISQRDVPVLVVHGTQDAQVPLDSCSVFSYKDRITSDRVEYLLCDAGHTDLLYDGDGTANDALMEQIHEFLLRSLEG